MSKFDTPVCFDGETYGHVIAGHFNEPESYGTARPNGMSDWLITYTMEGEGCFNTPAGEGVCRKGDVTLLKPGTPHQYGTRKGGKWHFVWAHFQSRILEGHYLPDEELLVHHIDSESARKRIYRAFRRAISDIMEQRPYWKEISENSVREVLLILLQRVSKQMDPRVEETLQLLSRDFREPVRIESLAKAVGLSPSRLSHLFKENTGRSILDTWNGMRIRQAALLLERTDRTAAEAAADAGFTNYNHFAKLFIRLYGMTPSAFRQSHRQNERLPGPR